MISIIGTTISFVILGALSIGYIGIVLTTLFSLVAAPLVSIVLSFGPKRWTTEANKKTTPILKMSAKERRRAELESSWLFENGQTG